MQFEYDPERLIEEVRKRPGIWNYEGTEYKARNTRHRLWNEVVMELMQSDINVTKSEMRELEIQLQKKWKSIRDCFRKYVSDPTRTRRPYIYCKQLQFLINAKWKSPKDDIEIWSDTDDSFNKPKTDKWRKKQKIKLDTERDETSDEDNADAVDTQDDSRDYSYDGTDLTNTSPTPAKQPKLSKIPVQIDDFAFANVDPQGKADGEDTDKMFLLSLLPHLKSVPEEYRLNVKMDMMQVLRNASFNVTQHNKVL